MAVFFFEKKQVILPDFKFKNCTYLQRIKSKSMKSLIATAFTLLFSIGFAQTNKETAVSKTKEAVGLMEKSQIKQSLKLLDQAFNLDPENIDIVYEMGYAYYLDNDYKNAIKKLESVINSNDATDRYFELLGNSYDMLGKSEKAVNIYTTGLKKNPKSGPLHLELGVMMLLRKEYNNALNYFEQGIDRAPDFSSNYYWASKLYFSTEEEVWGMMYGEIFMNLERNSKRTKEISKLLYDTYKSEIKVASDSSYSVSFSKNNTVKDLKKIPFGIAVYEPILVAAVGVEAPKEINLQSMVGIRKHFIDIYSSKKMKKSERNVLFDFEKKLAENDFLEAYSYWILMKGDDEGFSKWAEENKETWDKFVTYFSKNPIEINEENKFNSGQ